MPGNAMIHDGEKPTIPVLQGKRGILQTRSGQIRHLPSPVGSVMVPASPRKVWI